MKKGIYTLVALVFALGATAQEIKDTAITFGGTSDYFYSMDDGHVAGRKAVDWDIAFEINGFSGSIRINGGKGMQLFNSPYAVADFANVDTTGMAASWEELLNSRTTWSVGAFNAYPDGNFDLGWGTYNPQTHVVSGDSVYVMKMADNSYKKIYINKLASSKYTFTTADLDGSNEEEHILDKADYKNKLFGYYNLSTKTTSDPEPTIGDWDILFAKYVDLVQQGPTPTPYPVTGILVNAGVEVAQRDGMAVSSDDTSSLTWTSDISTIGSDWKTYNFGNRVYDITADQAFFIRTRNGAVWKLYFTKFEGGTVGRIEFTKKLIKASASTAKVERANYTVYPNPSASGLFTISGSEDMNGASYAVAAVNGQVVQNGTLNSNKLDLSELQDGVYFLNLVGNNYSGTQVLIKK